MFLCDEVQLFDTPGQYLGVDFAWYVAPVGGSLELKLFSDSLRIEVTFTLSSFTADPFEAIVGQELGHLFDLLLVVVPFDGELGDLVNAVITCGHRQLLILVLKHDYLFILLSQFRLEGRVHLLELGQSLRH